MKQEKTFYIGWQNEMAPSQRTFLKWRIIPIFILLPLLALLLVMAQKPFNAFNFEFGELKEFTGIYHTVPVPVLEILGEGGELNSTDFLLLVGYGKFGAGGIMEEIEAKEGALDGKKITLRGTRIQGDGKTLIELTEEENSLLKVFADPAVKSQVKIASTEVEYFGEILDPKCYFGVMKPAEGKIHKSCAIRCISGGIPPVFRVKKENAPHEYFVLLGANGEKVNREILQHVAEPVQIKGKRTRQNGWNIIYADPQAILQVDK